MRRTHRPVRALCIGVVAVWGSFTGPPGAPAATAQQVIEIDLGAGRTIIDEQWRSMGSRVLALDRDRGILYVNDDEEPEGIMAFSLATGERIRTMLARRGDGPFEFSQGHTGMAVAPAGGLYVSGLLRVVEYDVNGDAVNSWRPRVPTSLLVCSFGGAPAVAAQYGVVRRGADGQDEGFGASVVMGTGIVAQTREQGLAMGDLLWDSRIACTDEAAYVVMSHGEGPDSVFVYRRDGGDGSLAVPTDFTEDLPECFQWGQFGSSATTPTGPTTPRVPCPTWNQNLYPSVDEQGNIALMGYHREIAGALVDPDTGCYAVLRKPNRDRAADVARIYQDSALVFTLDTGEGTVGGQATTIMYSGSASRVSLHPLRRASGEPCPGMLPSVN